VSKKFQSKNSGGMKTLDYQGIPLFEERIYLFGVMSTVEKGDDEESERFAGSLKS
jgi:hypothetical protein